MQSHEIVLTYIDIVRTFSQVEVENADGIHLLHLLVAVAQVDVFRDSLGYTI